MIDLLQMQHALAHDPCRRSDRNPLGAVRVGEKVTLMLRVEKCSRKDISGVFLEFVNDSPAVLEDESQEGGGQALVWRQIPMKETEEGYKASIDTSGSTRAIFYRFRVCTALSDILYLKRSDNFSTAGISCLPNVWIEEMDPTSAFQLTVYEPGFETPQWMQGATMYQIFPDRFFQGEHGLHIEGVNLHRDRGWPVKVHEDWNGSPDWIEPYVPVDFFGGTLKGIEERLGYIESLGIDVIYLNPVCEAKSNHRYDTGDYEEIDPILGDWEDFEDLCNSAREKGIRIVLDTVLSHTGASSKYFNIDDSYDSVGAAQSEQSPYRNWYDFSSSDIAPYKCWWNDPSLPEIDERDSTWQSYMLGAGDGGGVLCDWASHGASGFRLDVADEIPDDVLEKVRASIKSHGPDHAIIGEVWEDPTTKVSYGARRTYALGRSLDTVMNYPLRAQLIQFALGNISAAQLSTFLRLQKSNYPKPFYDSLMNLLSSHDVERIRSILSLGREFKDLPRDKQLELTEAIDIDADWKASIMQRMLAMICYMLPGMPCLYYGDEKGMHGGRDPFCRASFPWEGKRSDVGEDLTQYYQALGKFRRESISLRKGSASFSYFMQDVICIVRIFVDEDGAFEGMLCVANRTEEPVRAVVDLADEATGLSDADIIALRLRSTMYPKLVFSTDSQNMAKDRLVTLEDGIFIGELGPMEGAIYQISPGLGASMPRGSGVVCHITSVPVPDSSGANASMGTLGAPARAFVDALSRAGIKYWQILPIGPTDAYGSPYAGLSAFAGNAALIEGDLDADDIEDAIGEEGFSDFVEQNKEWLYKHAAYCALKSHYGGEAWWLWPKKHRIWSEGLCASGTLRELAIAECARQYIFDKQWRNLRMHAEKAGVKLVGDMPFYVSADSPDVWAHPELFSVDPDGQILEEGGVPPDGFSEAGQLWGVPTYDWEAMSEDGCSWWVSRFKRMIELFDFTRIDHFIGFSAYYAVEKGKSALEGSWKKGPGIELFKKASDILGPLPLIAEDLGLVTPEVRQLLAQTGFPGMEVVEFFDGDAAQDWHPRSNRIVYSSTHDTQTLVGWAKSRYCKDEDEESARKHARQIAKKLMYKVLNSSTDVVMFALQDIIGLDDEARMNVPGTKGGNWTWQASSEDVEGAYPFMRRIASRRH